MDLYVVFASVYSIVVFDRFSPSLYVTNKQMPPHHGPRFIPPGPNPRKKGSSEPYVCVCHQSVCLIQVDTSSPSTRFNAILFTGSAKTGTVMRLYIFPVPPPKMEIFQWKHSKQSDRWCIEINETVAKGKSQATIETQCIRSICPEQRLREGIARTTPKIEMKRKEKKKKYDNKLVVHSESRSSGV